jgi:hypothetical protein
MAQVVAPINPTKAKFTNFDNVLRWAQSIHTSLSAGLTLALGKNSDSSGVYNTFDNTNGNGIMVRIGAAAGAEVVKWNSGTSQATIAVNLIGRKPTGWIVCDIDKPCYIYRAAPPNTTSLVLETSDTTCSITVWIF